MYQYCGCFLFGALFITASGAVRPAGNRPQGGRRGRPPSPYRFKTPTSTCKMRRRSGGRSTRQFRSEEGPPSGQPPGLASASFRLCRGSGLSLQPASEASSLGSHHTALLPFLGAPRHRLAGLRQGARAGGQLHREDDTERPCRTPLRRI